MACRTDDVIPEGCDWTAIHLGDVTDGWVIALGADTSRPGHGLVEPPIPVLCPYLYPGSRLIRAEGSEDAVRALPLVT